MKYYGIKKPGTEIEESYIHWISRSKYESWRLFFQYPNELDTPNYHRLSIAEAIKAYEAIGYKCVELEMTEINQLPESDNNEH